MGAAILRRATPIPRRKFAFGAVRSGVYATLLYLLPPPCSAAISHWSMHGPRTVRMGHFTVHNGGTKIFKNT